MIIRAREQFGSNLGTTALKFGRKRVLSKKKRAAILAEHESGKKVTNIAIDFDVSRSMVYRVIESNTNTG